MEAALDKKTFGVEEGEYCPACSHPWWPDGPAHFPDCRYFCLDDDRDEMPHRSLWATFRDMAATRVQHFTF